MDPPPLKKFKDAGDDIEIQPLSYHEQVGLIFVINESAGKIWVGERFDINIYIVISYSLGISGISRT